MEAGPPELPLLMPFEATGLCPVDLFGPQLGGHLHVQDPLEGPHPGPEPVREVVRDLEGYRQQETPQHDLQDQRRVTRPRGQLVLQQDLERREDVLQDRVQRLPLNISLEVEGLDLG